MNGKKRKGFFYGAMVLTAGMAAVKIIGALFKIPLKQAIGEYGMGLFNVAYNFYGPVFSLATAGFPIAVSRMVSESVSLGRQNDARQVRKAALPLFLAFGGAGTVLLTLLAPVYCERVIGNSGALYPMLALAPAILFACWASVYRGWYEGLGDMAPTAVSQVLEALVKLGLGLFAAFFLVSKGREEYAALGTVFGICPATSDEAVFLTLAFAAAGAVLGVTAGSLVSLLYLAARCRSEDKAFGRAAGNGPPAEPMGDTLRRLLRIALPVAAGSAAVNAAGLIDATFLQNRMAAVMEMAPERLLRAYEGQIPRVYLENPETVPTFLYGCYTLALTVYLLVPSITQAFGISALPAVTEAWARGDRKELRSRMEAVLRVTALFCFPAGIGIVALAGPVTRLLYGAGEAAPITAGALALLGIASLAAAMSTPLSSMLQAVGRADLPVKLLCGALAVKLVVNWWLCGIPEVNIRGAGAGTLLCYLFLTAAQLRCLGKAAGERLPWGKLFLPPLLCAALCGAGAAGAYEALARVFPGSGEAFRVGSAVVTGALLYAAGLLILGCITKNELILLPKGQKVVKMLEKREEI